MFPELLGGIVDMDPATGRRRSSVAKPSTETSRECLNGGGNSSLDSEDGGGSDSSCSECSDDKITELRAIPSLASRSERRVRTGGLVEVIQMEYQHRGSHLFSGGHWGLSHSSGSRSGGGVTGGHGILKRYPRELGLLGNSTTPGHNRLQNPRLSLLGKPLNYRPTRQRDPRYRVTQIRVSNLLERPRGWIAVIYHLFV